MKTASPSNRRAPWQFFLLMAAVFAVSVGYGIVLPVLPFRLERLLGEAARFSVAWHTGMIAGLYMLALFLFAPLWGRVSDHVGRRPVILLGLGGCIVALLLFGTADSLWEAYLARGLGGALVAAVLPVTLAYVSDTSARMMRARRYAWMSTASTLGFLMGPVLGAWLIDASGAGFSRPFFVATAAGAVVWLAIWFGLPEAGVPRPAAAPVKPKARPAAGPLTALLLLALLGMFGLGSFEVAVALQGARVLGFDPGRIGVLFMVCSLVMVLVQVLVFSPLAQRAGFGHIIAPAFAIMALSLLALPAAAAFSVVLALAGLFAAGSGILIPMLAYRVSLQAPGAQGAALGKQTAAASLGQGLGSAAGGWLFGLAAQAPFWITAALLLAGAALGWRSGRGSLPRIPSHPWSGAEDTTGGPVAEEKRR